MTAQSIINPWAGELPKGWQSLPLRRLANRYAGGTPSKNEPSYWEQGTIPWINSGAVNQGVVIRPSAYISEAGFQNSSARWVPKGALVIALAGQGKTKATVALMGIEATCNQSMAALVPNSKLLGRYLYYWLHSQYGNIRGLAADEARDGLNLEMLGSIPCPVPPLATQNAITAYLEKRTEAIDQLIAKKQRMVELLQEKRLALISKTVTKGLNPNAAMKSSGVAWLRNVPEHWEVSRLKSGVLSAKNGVWGQDPSGGENDVVCVRVADFDRQGFVAERKAKTMREVDPEQFDSRNLKSGDILLEKSGGGEKQPVGFAVLFDAEGKAVCSNFVARVRLNSSTDPVFTVYLLAYLYHSRVNVRSIKQSTGIQNLDSEQYFQELVAWPPLNEQIQIGAFLKTKSAAFLEAVAKIERQCELLREYRRALITAAVTGKIDITAETSGSA